MNNNSTRASSLDALRGYAILTMVLSGSIAWGVLPGWMYHAQVGPRSNFVFDGSIYGITWVDLVFPFFLFAMGAAFPFSIGNKYRKGTSRWRMIYDSILRGFRLTFFFTLRTFFLRLALSLLRFRTFVFRLAFPFLRLRTSDRKSVV